MKIFVRGLKSKKQKRIIEGFCKKACRLLPPLRKKGELSFIFVDDMEIRKINRKFLNHDRPTDVIAFSYDSPTPQLPNSTSHPAGDVFISVDTAQRLARKGGYPAIQELALYALHGLLHLAGHDDHNPRDRKKIFAAQTKLFRKLAPRLAPPDFR